MQKIEFDNMQTLRRMVAAVAVASSNDEERADIYGVHITATQPGEARAEATNGSWCMRIDETCSYCDLDFDCLIPPEYARRLLVMIGDRFAPARIVRDEKLVRFFLENLGTIDLYIAVAEPRFPNLSKAWPTEDPIMMTAIGVAPQLMANLGKAFAFMTEKPTLRFSFHGNEAPIVVECEEAPNASALLMPCRLHDDKSDDDRQTELFPGEAPKVAKPAATMTEQDASKISIEEVRHISTDIAAKSLSSRLVEETGTTKVPPKKKKKAKKPKLEAKGKKR